MTALGVLGCDRSTSMAQFGLIVMPVLIMSADAMVDAAFAGFDQGELITIPSLPDFAELGGL